MGKDTDFLQYCLHDDKPLPASVGRIDWMKMIDVSGSQGISGVIYTGIEKGKKELQMPLGVLMEWVGFVQQIENQNKFVNRMCVKVFNELRAAGFECVLLKGQGNALMYPRPLLRMSGDIDILVTNKSRQAITSYVKERKNVTGHHYQHLEYEEDGCVIEIHFMLCSQSNPLYRRRLNKELMAMVKGGGRMAELPDGVGSIPVPTWTFNVLFQLAHMMHHFFDEGVGLKHMVDYYYLLTGCEAHDDLTEQLKRLNLYDFAGAVMYVMKTTLDMDDRFLIAPVDERRGQALLKDIKKGGNFGRNHGLTEHFTGKRFFLKSWRNMHFLCDYPAEVLCEPFYRTWHFFWRKFQ